MHECEIFAVEPSILKQAQRSAMERIDLGGSPTHLDSHLTQCLRYRGGLLTFSRAQPNISARERETIGVTQGRAPNNSHRHAQILDDPLDSRGHLDLHR